MVAGSPQGRFQDLETLARERFGGLSNAELALLRAAPKGEVAVCGPTDRDDDLANDPANADTWGPERQIRAELVRWLCVDSEAASRVDPKGIQVHGAKVVGELDLSFANVPFPVGFFRCRLTHDADLKYSLIPGLNLNGTWTRSITADGIIVQGSVFLNEKFSAEGEVRLLGAQIGGNLDCSGGTFKNPEKNALSADGANVRGDVFLRKGFNAEGEVRLLVAQIGGDLDCDGGTFKNPSKDALSTDGTNVRGDVFLHKGFSAEGEVRLLGVQIGGNLECDGGTFKNPGKDALSADGVNVQGSVFFCEGFSAEGAVRLLGAQIGGDLDCNGGRFTEVSAKTAVIKGNFIWLVIPDAQKARLNLINASAGALVDEEASWPAAGNLKLDGFVYGRISAGPTDAQKRLEWLARLNQFTLQPYRQLATVLRELGDTGGARQVLFEMEHRRRKLEDQSWRARLWSQLLEITIGYGHKPWRALEWLGCIMALGFLLFGLGYFGGGIVPSDRTAYETFEQTGLPPPYYPRFNALVYSLEHSFPLVNLGQKDHWGPSPDGPGREPVLEWRFFAALRDSHVWDVRPFRLPTPGLLRFLLCLQILAGWLLATLFVYGLAEMMRAEK
jgi:hypothetical protein